MNYKFSIITINKNKAAGLEKTCLSVVTQTFKNYDWIIIDGGSTDNSIDIIKNHSNYLSYWVSEPDSGVYNAMNKGIRKATGDYLLFLNSGDHLLHPWTLQELYNEMSKKSNTDIFYSNSVTDTFEITIQPDNISFDYLINNSINHQNCLFKKELFEHQLYDETYTMISDWYFMVIKMNNSKISFIHLNTIMAMVEKIGISSDKYKRFEEKSNAFEKLGIKRKKIRKFKFLRKIKKIIVNILPYGIYKLVFINK